MSKMETHSDLVLALAEEFVARYRKGERPSLREYIDRHPELAAEIREVFPAMALMENIALVQEEESTPAPAAAEPLPLQQLGDYRLIRAVGHGGMGIVYEAEQVSLGRHVALKLLPRKLLADSKHRRRFEREARLAAKLHHTNIVPVFGVGEQDGLPYYVMQFIQGLGLDQVLQELKRLRAAGEANSPAAAPETPPGKDLSAAEMARSLLTGQFEAMPPDSNLDPSPAEEQVARVEEKSLAAPSAGHLVKSLSDSSVVLPGQSGPSGQRKAKPPTYWQSVAQIGVQVAQALEYAHQQGVLHRDIKPSNLLLDRRTTVWVTDFGLAKASDSEDLTHTGDVLGTLRYMPPEAFEGKSDARSDLYSLGLTLYELLAFRPAFDGKDRHKLVKQVTTGESPRLDRLNPEVPRDLVTVVHKAIDRDPRQRYATAGELAADLQHFADDEPIKARPLGPVERVARWCRHNPMLAGSLSAVAATLILGTVVAWLMAVWALTEKDRATEQAAQTARALERERRLYYGTSLALVQQAWESHNMLDFHNRLADTADSPERGFEWDYWQRLSRKEHLMLVGHAGGVTTVAFAPDGQRLATGGKDGTSRIWDADSGQEVFCLRGHRSEVTAVVFAAHGRWLVTGSTDGTAKLWDLSTGHILRTLKGQNTGAIWAVAVTPDARRVLIGSQDGGAGLWDAASGQQLLNLAVPPSPVWGVAVTPDGTQLVTGSQLSEIKFWDAVTGRELRTLKGGSFQVNSLAMTADCKRVITGSMDGTARIWDVATGTVVLSLSTGTDWYLYVAVTPDGQRLMTGHATGAARVWEMVYLPDIGVSTAGLLSSPQAPGPLLAVSALYQGRADALGGREIMVLMGHRQGINCVAVSPDGRRLATTSPDGTARIWDMAGGRGTRTLKVDTGPVWSLGLTPDGKRLVTASGDGTAKVWDLVSGRQLLLLKGHANEVRSVAVTPDGQRIITGSADGTARVWDALSGRQLVKTEALELGKNIPAALWSLAVTADGQRLVTANWDRAVVWDATDGRKLRAFEGPLSILRSVTFTPDAKRVVLGCWQDGTTRLRDISSDREILVLPEPTGHVSCVAVTPDGQRLITGRDDGKATVWGAINGEQLFSLNGHTDYVTSIAVPSDGRRIITGSVDGTARLWDAVSGRQLLILRGQGGPVWSVAIAPNGRQLVTGHDDGTVRVWEAAAPEEAVSWARQDKEAERQRAAWKLPAVRAPAVEARSPDHAPPEGFIGHWLVLAPLALKSNEQGVKGLESEQLRGEARLQPRAGQQETVGDQHLTWQEYHVKEPVLDFHRFVGKPCRNSVAYAVCYVFSAVERHDLLLQLGSTEQAKVYLNGREVYKNSGAFGTAALEPIGPVPLDKGTNVLVLKVVNTTAAWRAFARFVDLDGNPAQGLEMRVRPD